jgi:hypothetical protein
MLDVTLQVLVQRLPRPVCNSEIPRTHVHNLNGRIESAGSCSPGKELGMDAMLLNTDAAWVTHRLMKPRHVACTTLRRLALPVVIEVIERSVASLFRIFWSFVPPSPSMKASIWGIDTYIALALPRNDRGNHVFDTCMFLEAWSEGHVVSGYAYVFVSAPLRSSTADIRDEQPRSAQTVAIQATRLPLIP